DHAAAAGVGRIADQVAKATPEILVGSALSPDPGGVPTIYVKGPASDLVKKLVREADLEINLIDQQPFSYNELAARNDAAYGALVASGYRNVALGADIRHRGQLSITVQVGPGLLPSANEILGVLPAEVRENASVEVRTAPVGEYQFSIGGLLMRDDGVFECSSGWTVWDSSGAGAYGLTSAAHCSGLNQVVHGAATFHDADFEAQHLGVFGDIEWYTTASNEPAEFFSTDTTIRDTVSVEAWSNISVGESVCVYSRQQGTRFCGRDVQTFPYACLGANRLVLTDGADTIGGDSGSGWSFNSTAFGGHVGLCSVGAVFSVADYFDDAIPGIAVHTTTYP
ncbi:MAG TPA: hypothetical protein VHO25_14115, partial [Polyangiaceae bacterium]|nr:hypothetical protein [Polyangiaceae bacterium]